MADKFAARSLETISKAIRAAIRAEIPGSDPALFPNNLYVWSKVWAGIQHGLEQRIESLLRQIHVSTADNEALARHGADRNITAAPATLASGTLNAVTVVATVIPINTVFLRSDGAQYRSTAEVTATATLSEIPVISLETGKKYNTVPGAVLTLQTPITGVGAVEVSDDGLSGGTDAENDASLRLRILQRLRNPPHGGSPGEYIDWVTQGKPGATRVYVQRAFPSPGSVTITFMMDDTYTDGIPSLTDIADVQTYLNDVAPSNANVIVQRPEPITVDVTISGLSPNKNYVKGYIELELKAMFKRRSQPGSAASPFVFSRSWLVEAIASATGEYRHNMTLPAGDITVTETSAGVPYIAVLGTVTYI